MNYSFPTTNHTCPVPLLGRHNSTVSGTSAQRKVKDENVQNEEYV